MKYPALAAWVLLSAGAAAQSEGRDAAAILKNVGAVYGAPSSLELRGTKVREKRDEFNDIVIRVPFTLLLTPDDRFRMESKSKMGTSIQVCDGEKNWNYMVQSKKYFVSGGKLDPWRSLERSTPVM